MTKRHSTKRKSNFGTQKNKYKKNHKKRSKKIQKGGVRFKLSSGILEQKYNLLKSVVSPFLPYELLYPKFNRATTLLSSKYNRLIEIIQRDETLILLVCEELRKTNNNNNNNLVFEIIDDLNCSSEETLSDTENIDTPPVTPLTPEEPRLQRPPYEYENEDEKTDEDGYGSPPRKLPPPRTIQQTGRLIQGLGKARQEANYSREQIIETKQRKADAIAKRNEMIRRAKEANELKKRLFNEKKQSELLRKSDITDDIPLDYNKLYPKKEEKWDSSTAHNNEMYQPVSPILKSPGILPSSTFISPNSGYLRSQSLKSR
jgi:hypothetical protein